jgi:anti-sigma factor ChrR (cupin superfamily)
MPQQVTASVACICFSWTDAVMVATYAQNLCNHQHDARAALAVLGGAAGYPRGIMSDLTPALKEVQVLHRVLADHDPVLVVLHEEAVQVRGELAAVLWVREVVVKVIAAVP